MEAGMNVRLTYQAIIDNAMAAVGAGFVYLTQFTPETQLVSMAAMSGLTSALISSLLAAARRLFPDFDPMRITFAAGVNRRSRALYVEGESVSAPAAEFAEGIVDARLAELAATIMGVRELFFCPLKVRGRVVGALGFHTAAPLTAAERRTCDAFARQVALTFELSDAEQRLETLYGVTRHLGESLSLEAVSTAVLDAAVQLFAADHAAIFQETEPGRFVCLASFRLSPAYVEVVCQHLPIAPAYRQTVTSRAPVFIPDVQAAAEGTPLARAIEAEGIRAVLGVPLLRQGWSAGYFAIYHDRPRSYDDGEIQLVRTLAEQIAIAIDNARLHAAAQSRAGEVEALLEATKQIAGSLDFATTLTIILEAVVRLAEADAAGVALLDAGGTLLRFEASSGPDADLFRDRSYRPGEGLAGLVFETGEAINVPYAEVEGRWAHPGSIEAAGIRSALLVPLRSGGKVIGVLASFSSKPAHFTAARERLLVGMAEQAALGIEHARLFAEVGKLEAFRELNRLKSEFIATVSHELRTPLSLVLGYAELLVHRNLSAAEARPMIEGIHEGAQRLAELVNDVMDFSQIEQGEFPIELAEVDLLPLVAGMVNGLAATAAGHQVIADLPDGPILVRGDARRLRQVVENLLSNAVRYSPNGGRLVVRATVRDGEVQVGVADQGVGLAPDQLERVFEKFYRGRSEVMHQQPGIGLGLAISRYIVEAHGGRIWAESPGPGQGAAFYFTVPVICSEPLPAL